jgi:DNA adenine methylase
MRKQMTLMVANINMRSLSSMKHKPIISWPGGKSRLAKYILPLFPEHTCYVEPFCGGLGMFLARDSVKPSTVEVVNDFNGDLVNLFRVVKYHSSALLAELDLCPNSRADFEAFIAQPGLTDIQRAARWFMRRKNCFSGTDTSFPCNRTSPLSSMENKLEDIRLLAHRLDRVTIEHLDYRVCIARYDAPGTLFFMDPPYAQDGGGDYKGWTVTQTEELADLLARTKGRWVLTVDDSAANRRIFGRWEQIPLTRNCSVNNVTSTPKDFGELVVCSSPVSLRCAAA